MSMTNSASSKIDLEKFRLRTFVDRLIDMGEVEIHDEPVPLTGVGADHRAHREGRAVQERRTGEGRDGGQDRGQPEAPDRRVRNHRRKNLRRVFQAPGQSEARGRDASGDAPVHAVQITGKDVDLTKLPFYPHHAYDGSCYLSSATDYTIDPATGRRNVGCRRLSLRNRYETGTNVTAPSDLKRIYTASVARGEKLPITFTVGTHPLDFVAATMRHPGDELALVATLRGEPAAVVKSLTNDILVPADAEMTLEGYLDERGYVEPEGPVRRIHGLLRRDPHGPGVSLHRHHHAPRRAAPHACSTARHFSSTRPTARTSAPSAPRPRRCKSSRPSGRDPVAAYMRHTSGGSNTMRVSIRQRSFGEARLAIAALFGGIARLKHVFVFDEDIDIRNDLQVEWALGTRFQADQDLVILQGIPGMSMDPSLQGRRTGAKSGFDCTKPFGRDGEIPLTRSAAKVFKGPARFQNIEQALSAAPMFYADLVEAIGSDDGREIACGLDELRQNGRLGRDRDGRYHLAPSKPGVTAIVGDLYHDPNSGL